MFSDAQSLIPCRWNSPHSQQCWRAVLRHLGVGPEPSLQLGSQGLVSQAIGAFADQFSCCLVIPTPPSFLLGFSPFYSFTSSSHEMVSWPFHIWGVVPPEVPMHLLCAHSCTKQGNKDMKKAWPVSLKSSFCKTKLSSIGKHTHTHTTKTKARNLDHSAILTSSRGKQFKVAFVDRTENSPCNRHRVLRTSICILKFLGVLILFSLFH